MSIQVKQQHVLAISANLMTFNIQHY